MQRALSAIAELLVVLLFIALASYFNNANKLHTGRLMAQDAWLCPKVSSRLALVHIRQMNRTIDIVLCSCFIILTLWDRCYNQPPVNAILTTLRAFVVSVQCWQHCQLTSQQPVHA